MSKKINPLKAFASIRNHRNVVLNFRNSAQTEFGPYGRAFHEAARLLAKPVLERGVRHDLEGPPIVYMYRHALELQVKGVLLAGNELMAFYDKELAEEDLLKLLNGHLISRFLPRLESIFRFMEWKDPIDHGPIQNFADIESIVRDLERVDRLSFAFRYPTDKKGNPSLEEHSCFSLSHFVEVMDPLIEFLYNCVCTLEHTRDDVCEHLSYSDGE